MRRQLLVLLSAALLWGCGAEPAPPPSEAELEAAASGEVRGFVFSDWGYEIPREFPGDCPDGMNITEPEFLSDEYAAVSDEVKQLYEAGDRKAAVSLLPADACQDPAVRPDPGHLTMNGPASQYGIDLDGEHSELAAGGSCAHEDFTSPDGTRGIDSQYWRLMGCVAGYRPDGLFDRLFSTGSSITENGYSQLIEMTLVEGTAQDGRVSLRLFTGAGPPMLDAAGAVMSDTSQFVNEDPTYHSEPFEGVIKDGILTAGPGEVRLRFKVQAIDNEFWFRDARIRAEMLPDGSMEGLLAGYWDSESVFDFLTDVSFGPVHLGRAAANNIGYMCAGVYHALPRVADGHPDPETGECTSISTTIRFAAVPGFVMQPETLANATP